MKYLKLNMNDYTGVKIPKSFHAAEIICQKVGESLKCTLDEAKSVISQ